LDPVERKYSKKLPSIWRATSLKAKVGPWNNSYTYSLDKRIFANICCYVNV
jgi:hypothetical protein